MPQTKDEKRKSAMLRIEKIIEDEKEMIAEYDARLRVLHRHRDRLERQRVSELKEMYEASLKDHVALCASVKKVLGRR